MTTFVLIHGAWHYGALWEEVAQPLRESGHAVHAPTLAGNGPGDDIDRTVGHRDAVASAVDYVLKEDLTDFVLLGHSYGGTIISRMAEEMPGRIRRLVYWNAFVLNDGESIESVSPPHYKQLMDSIAESGEHGPGAVKLPFPVWREAFMNDADLALAEKTYELTTPHPLRTLTDSGRAQVLPRAPDPALVSELHRGYRDAAGGIRLVPAFSGTPRPLPVGADAGRARSVFHQPGAAGREDRRSGQRLNAPFRPLDWLFLPPSTPGRSRGGSCRTGP